MTTECSHLDTHTIHGIMWCRRCGDFLRTASDSHTVYVFVNNEALGLRPTQAKIQANVEDMERSREQLDIAAADFIPQDLDQYKKEEEGDDYLDLMSCWSCEDRGCDECAHLDVL
jgi:hypothetical protein